MGAEEESYPDLPLKNVQEDDIDDNDILLGRGGKTNHHPGNASYLEQIKARELEYYYLESRTEKTEYAMEFVHKLRKEGIRFLKKDDKDTKLWHDVGDVKMREKVSQNLREKQPDLKKRLAKEQEMRQRGGMSPVRSDSTGTANSHSHSPRPQPIYSNSPIQNNSHQQLHQTNMEQFMRMRNPQMQSMSQQQQMMYMLQQQQQQQQQQQPRGSMGSNSSGGSGGMGGYPTMVPSDGGVPFMGGAVIQENGAPMPPMRNNYNQQNYNTGYNQNYNNNNNNNNDYNSDPLDAFNTQDQFEADLVQGFGANDHPLRCNTPPPPSNNNNNNNNDNDGGLLSPEEESKLRAAEGDPLPPQRTARPNMMSVRGRSTDFGLPINDVPGMENFAAMGNSTTSLLDTLEVEPVPEGEEDRGDVSPKPTRPTATAAGGGGGPYTPVLSNRHPPLTRDNPHGPATVSPIPNSGGGGGGGGQQSTNFLDDDILHAWANTDGDSDFTPLVMHPAVPGQSDAPFRRTQSHQDDYRGSSPRPAAAPMRRMGTAPSDLSPRPSAMTKDKRATSNVAETPETRGHLSPQPSLATDPSSSHSTGSNFSIKKASLGRDKSEQSRLLKQQCMPKAFAMNSFSASTNSNSSESSNYSNNSWMGAAGFPNPQQQQQHYGVPSTPPMQQGGKHTVGQLDREITPRTYAVMQDFGKLTVAHDQSPGRARTATRFEDTVANRTTMEASQSASIEIPMELMVQRPPMMTWRNRTSTIEALDLGPLDDDPILLEGGGGGGGNTSRRASRNSISRMWANMPASADFDAFVSNLASQEVQSLVPEGPPTPLGTEALSLPNLKA